MRNRLARLFLVAALALLVSACGGGNAGSDSADPVDTSRFVTTTTSPAGGAGGASEATIGDDDETDPSGADDATLQLVSRGRGPALHRVLRHRAGVGSPTEPVLPRVQVGDLGPPEGESILGSDDMDDCRRIGQQDAADEAEG